MRRGLSPGGILTVWERGRERDAVGRALALWEAAEPEVTRNTLESSPIGRRDAALLRLRTELFGSRAECFVRCPHCDAQLEFEVDLETVVTPPPEEGPGPWEVEAEDWDVSFRLPDSRDLAAVAGNPDPESALLQRCVLSASRKSATTVEEPIPAAVATSVEDEMARLDPQAEVSFELTCGDCAQRWEAMFDIAAFLWREIEVEARRLLREVDALARTYGWSEGEILALDGKRRRSYLELMRAL